MHTKNTFFGLKPALKSFSLLKFVKNIDKHLNFRIFDNKTSKHANLWLVIWALAVWTFLDLGGCKGHSTNTFLVIFGSILVLKIQNFTVFKKLFFFNFWQYHVYDSMFVKNDLKFDFLLILALWNLFFRISREILA